MEIGTVHIAQIDIIIVEVAEYTNMSFGRIIIVIVELVIKMKFTAELVEIIFFFLAM